MDDQLKEAISALVKDLVAGKYDTICADGRNGRLSRSEIAYAVGLYGRTLVVPPNDMADNVSFYPLSKQPGSSSLDVTLWTAEEGRSDLTLLLTARRSAGGGYVLSIEDLRVL